MAWFFNKYFLYGFGLLGLCAIGFVSGYTVKKWEYSSIQLELMNNSFSDLQKNLNNAIIKSLQINEQQNEIIFEKNERLAKMQKSVETLQYFLAKLSPTGCAKLDDAHVQLLRGVTEVANREPGKASTAANPNKPDFVIPKSRNK